MLQILPLSSHAIGVYNMDQLLICQLWLSGEIRPSCGFWGCEHTWEFIVVDDDGVGDDDVEDDDDHHDTDLVRNSDCRLQSHWAVVWHVGLDQHQADKTENSNFFETSNLPTGAYQLL